MQNIQGNIKILSHCNEDGSAELNISRKIPIQKLEAKSSSDLNEISEKLIKIMQNEQKEMLNGILMHKELVRPIIEEKIRRKCGKTGHEYEGQRIIFKQ